MFCNESNAYCKVFAFALFLALFAGMASAHINIQNPLADAAGNASSVNFGFFFVSENDSVMNCTLYLNNTPYEYNETTLNDTAGDGSVGATNITHTFSTQGAYLWNITCIGQNDTLYSATNTFTYDTVAPVFSNFNVPDSSNDFFKNGSSVTFTTQVNDALSGIVNGTTCNPVMDSSGPSVTFTGDINYTNATNICTGAIVINTTGSGVKNLNLSISDRAGNSETVSKSFILDNLIPSVVVSGPVSNNIYANITVAAVISDEPVLGMDAVNYTNVSVYGYVGGALVNSTVSSGNGTKSIFVGVTEGIYNITITTFDKAGNENVTTITNVSVDTTAPTVTASAPEDNNLTNNATPNFTFTVTDNLAATTNCTLYVNGEGKGTNSSVANNTATTITPAANLTDGAKSWNVTCIDLASNAGSSANRTLSIDTVVPIVNVTSFPTVNIATGSNSVTLSGSCKRSVNVSINVTNGGSSVFNTTTCNAVLGTWSKALNLSSLPDGTLTAVVTQVDDYGNTGTGNKTSIKDLVAPTCAIYNITNLSSFAYANGSTLYYKNTAGAAFEVNVSSTDATSGVKNVTFGAITGFTAMGPLVPTAAPYNISYTWASGSIAGSQPVTCYDIANNSNSTYYTLVRASAANVTLSFAEPDIFYSPAARNNVINIRANVTGNVPVLSVSANFSNVTAVTGLCGASSPVVALSYNATSGYYEGYCNVLANAQASNFVGGAVVVTTTDSVSNLNVSTASVVLYNMTTPTSGDACMQFNESETTNFSEEMNFASINLRLSMMRNGSAACNGMTLPWGNEMKKVMFLNFTSVNLSTQAQAAKLQNLATAINVTISPPKAYSDSRIYVNSTYFAELNTTSSVTLYDLPFSSSPNVTTDAGAAGVSTTSWAQGAFDASYNASIGNFTLVVNGFSGYNATDNIAPVVTINAPTASQNLSSGMVAVNATLNGTGTEISAAYFRVNGTEVAYYNSTGNTAGCAAAASGSEIYNCAFSINLSNGAKSLNVTAYDFGAPAPGNMGSAARAFMVDTVAPVVSIQVPVANSVINVSNTTLNFTVSDALSTLNASSCEYSLNGTRVSLGASCANGTQLNFTSDGVKTLTVFAKDMSGNEGNTTISFLVNTAGSNSTIINTTTNATVNETIYVTPTSPASNITMGANATNVTLNMTAYNSSASFNVTLPEINVTANTSLGNVLVGIPNGTVASGAADWNGVLQLPIVRTGSFTPTAASGYTATAQAAVEIGVSDIAINLSRGVRILIPGKADQLVGFQRPTAGFVAITNVCGADSQAWADANITNGSECKINNGSDMVIWTKHFTMFGTYTQAANGGGSSGGSNNGGGSIIGGSSAPSSTKQASTTNVDVGLGKTCAVTITRSMSSTANLSVLTTTLENIGGAGCSMTDFVFSDTIPADFPALNDVTFNPMYATREGWTVNFSFPTFAAGESKTLSYSANQWIRTSLAKNFTAYTMAAKKQTTTAPSANTTTGPVVEEPSVWVPRPLPPMPTEQPAVQPSAPAQQPASADNSSALLLTALVVLAAAAGVAGVYLYMKGKKQGA